MPTQSRCSEPSCWANAVAEKERKTGQGRPAPETHYSLLSLTGASPNSWRPDQRSKSSGIFSNPRSVSAGILKVSLRICRAMRKVGDAGRFSREVHPFKQVAVALVAAQAIHVRIDLQAAQAGVTLF